MAESEVNALPKDVTEFSFSPDYKYLALGSQDGYAIIVIVTDDGPKKYDWKLDITFYSRNE